MDFPRWLNCYSPIPVTKPDSVCLAHPPTITAVLVYNSILHVNVINFLLLKQRVERLGGLLSVIITAVNGGICIHTSECKRSTFTMPLLEL